MIINENEEKLINESDKKEQVYIELKETSYNDESNDIKEKNEISNGNENKEKEEETGKISTENGDKKENLNDDNDSETSALIGKKIMKTVLFNLNSYWIGLIASISLFVTLYIYEFLGIYIIAVINSIIEDKTLDMINQLIDLLINKLGVKWLLIINISNHLSVGFFCLITFSSIFHDTKKIKKFFIMIFIEEILFLFTFNFYFRRND